MKPIWVVVIAVLTFGIGMLVGGFGGSLAGIGGGMLAGSHVGACSVLEAAREDNTIDATKAEQLYKKFEDKVRATVTSIDPKAEVQSKGYDCATVLAEFRKSIAEGLKK